MKNYDRSGEKPQIIVPVLFAVLSFLVFLLCYACILFRSPAKDLFGGLILALPIPLFLLVAFLTRKRAVSEFVGVIAAIVLAMGAMVFHFLVFPLVY